jgi:holo-[acyl-carrier protein] synthase
MEEVDRIGQLTSPIRTRFIERIFTPAECTIKPMRNEHITGVFCAKEAVAKALGCGIGEVSWHEVQILTDDHGKPIIQLSGKAAEIAASQGIQSWSVSISHTRTHAIAMVVGLGAR